MKHILYLIGSLIWMGTCMAANNPDDFELFQSVRQNQPQITSLSFHNRDQLTSLDQLKYFPNLRSLSMKRCHSVRYLIPTLSFLAVELHSLSIPCSNVAELEGIQNLKELEILNVCGGYRHQIQSMKPLVGLPLKYLNLGGQTDVRDLEYIQQFPKLERLGLSGVFYDGENYPPLSFLKPLSHLTHLDLNMGCMITNIEPVFTLTSLKSLVLNGVNPYPCYRENYLDGIERLQEIEYLALGAIYDSCNLSYLSNFLKLKKLQAYPFVVSKYDEAFLVRRLRKYLPSHVEITKKIDFPGWEW